MYLRRLGYFIDFIHSHWDLFLQPEDGKRDTSVTGVQTCALPISSPMYTGRTGPFVAPRPPAWVARLNDVEADGGHLTAHTNGCTRKAVARAGREVNAW